MMRDRKRRDGLNWGQQNYTGPGRGSKFTMGPWVAGKAEPGDNHCARDSMTFFGPMLVVHPRNATVARPAIDVRGVANHDIAGAETGHRLGQDRAERERTCQAVTEDG